jgi:hypothetical protein
MEELTKVHDTDEPTIVLHVEVRLPAEQARTFLEAMTGNDDDVLLAAERGMRDRMGTPDSLREIELSYVESESDVRERMEIEAATNDRRERLYGPAA